MTTQLLAKYYKDWRRTGSSFKMSYQAAHFANPNLKNNNSFQYN